MRYFKLVNDSELHYSENPTTPSLGFIGNTIYTSLMPFFLFFADGLTTQTVLQLLCIIAEHFLFLGQILCTHLVFFTKLLVQLKACRILCAAAAIPFCSSNLFEPLSSVSYFALDLKLVEGFRVDDSILGRRRREGTKGFIVYVPGMVKVVKEEKEMKEGKEEKGKR